MVDVIEVLPINHWWFYLTFLYIFVLWKIKYRMGEKNHVSTKLKIRTPTPSQAFLLPFYSPRFTFFLH